ncbi:cell division protein FtsQ/DivIB [Arthrobacter sp. ISL-30]|uniref:cell division protein FtsQ/DivIB n=1 Tax=Arthrobacter sp. ISL-30 TaxID=2819109 RepID=UPI001BE553BC|nr:cell division protein FtsQ/DivIB [Arthrobacter sp. ISL-30]MBT2512077.1 cell division protein FtsQ/DivIB [Arthrobacter sp. ISL-30]
MASGRKPSYRPAARSSPAASGVSRPRSTSRPGGPSVISAERSLDAAQAQGTNAQGQGAKAHAKLQEAKAPAKVLTFPESRRRKLKRRIIWVSSITAALVAALIVGAVYSPVLAIRTFTIDGTRLLAPDQVRTVLAPLEGKPLPQVGKDEVTGLLKPLVQVRSVTIEAHPPSELVVHVQERVPVALMKQGEQYLLVDVDGVQLGATADPESVALPLIDGGGTAVGKDIFAAITGVLGTLPPDILARMSTASAESVDSVKLKLDDGKTVVWGNAEEMELKARVLEALLRAPADPKVPVSVYDVSTPRHAFTK